MEPWRKVWRDGIAPQLNERQLRYLYHGVVSCDPRLIRGKTTVPSPVPGNEELPCLGACLVGYVVFDAVDRPSVECAELLFDGVFREASRLLGDMRVAMHLICWWDDNDDKESSRQLAHEIMRSIRQLVSPGKYVDTDK